MHDVVLHTVTSEATDALHPATLHTDWSEGEVQSYTARILHVIATKGLDVLHFHYAVPSRAGDRSSPWGAAHGRTPGGPPA